MILNAPNRGTGRGLSQELWRLLSPDVYSAPHGFNRGLFRDDDFMDLPTGRYTATQATSGTFTLGSTDEGGWVTADSGAATNDQGINVQETPWVKWELGCPLVFECRVIPAAIGTAGNYFLGLAATDTTIIASDAMTTSDFIGFKGLGSNSLKLCSRSGSGTEQVATTAVTTGFVASTAIKLGFIVTAAGVVLPYVNGVLVDGAAYRLDYSSSARPTALMGRSLVCQSNGTTQPTIAMDRWSVGKDKQYAA